MKPHITIGILAGGKSTRMGMNKALLEFETEKMIDRIIKSFPDMDIIISAADPGIYEHYGFKVVYDENRDIGPMEGIRQILLASDTDNVFICACDMPFINKDIALYLSGYISSDIDCLVISDDDHIHPLCAIYSKRVIPIIEKAITEGNYRLREILDNSSTKYISLEYTVFDKKILRNINTKDDYKALRLPVIFAVSGFKNSGKTWLIKKLINEFIKDGYSVSVIKHDGHDLISDAEGTDTYEFIRAGATATAVLSKSRYSVDVIREISYDAIEDMIRNIPDPSDVIILEGFKNSDIPKILIDSPDPENKQFDTEPVNCFMTITDRDYPVEDIYSKIKEHFEL